MDSKNKTQPDVISPQEPTPQSSFWSRRNIIIASVAGGVLVTSGVALAVWQNRDRDPGTSEQATTSTQTNTQSSSSNSSSAFLQDYLGKCEERDVKLTHSIIRPSELSHIEPLGKMQDAHVTPTDHQYWSPLNRNAADNTYDVLMPADGTIVDISKMPKQQIGDALSGQKTIEDDHRMTIAHSCRYFTIFIHVHKLSDAVASQVGTLDWGSSKQVNIKLKAGESVGRIGGNPVDWTFLDTSSTLKGFITPARYQSERWKIHTIDPLPLYEGDLKNQLMAKSVRTVEPVGGRIDYDQPGKLIGTWFRQGSGDYFGLPEKQMEPGYRYWDGHLSIVPDPIDPATTIVSIGNWAGQATQMAIRTKVDPASVSKASGPAKYELGKVDYVLPSGVPFNGQSVRGMKVSPGALQGTILVEVLDGEKLKVETFPGKSAAQVSGFTAAAVTYER